MLLGSPEKMMCYYYYRNLSLIRKAFSLEDVGISLISQSFLFLNRVNYFVVGFFLCQFGICSLLKFACH